MKLECYKLWPDVAEIIPATPERDWMDQTSNGYAYRCTPMTMANATGWFVLSPCAFTVEWNGGKGPGALTIIATDGFPNIQKFITTHFGDGIFTFTMGYIFKTPPSWSLWARGAPNWIKDGVAPLDGIIETDWLPFPFTMNWKMTRIGTVAFKKGDPLCFITPLQGAEIERFMPEITTIESNPALQIEYNTWAKSRTAFQAQKKASDIETGAQMWEKNYIRGQSAGGTKAPESHVIKRRLNAPKDRA